MATKSRIEWTGSTWNPITGCDKVSPGCDHCYAERMARRLQAMGVAKYRNGFKVTLHPDVLSAPIRWKKPHLVFVNSMADIFHKDVPIEYIQRIFEVMRSCPQHVFQVLTKRSKRMVRVSGQLPWPDNVWLGVTVETARYRFRIDDLRKTPARIKWLSLEPLLGPLGEVDLTDIDWAVVGGESGPGARPVQEEWILEIRRRCRRSGTAFFFKQWGGVNKKRTGRTLRGKIYDEMPDLPDGQGQLPLDLLAS